MNVETNAPISRVKSEIVPVHRFLFPRPCLTSSSNLPAFHRRLSLALFFVLLICRGACQKWACEGVLQRSAATGYVDRDRRLRFPWSLRLC